MKKHTIWFVIDLVMTVILSSLILILAAANGATSGAQSSTLTRLVNNTLSLFTPREIQEIPMTAIQAEIPQQMEYGTTYSIPTIITPTDTSDPTLEYTSSDSQVVKPDSQGNLTAVGLGYCTITVSSSRYPEVRESYPITVTGEEITAIEIADTITIQQNQVYLPEYQLTPANTYQEEILFTSDNTDLKVLEGNYIFSTVSGEYPLTVSSKDNPSIKKEISVKVENTQPYTLAEDFSLQYPKSVSLYEEFQPLVVFPDEVDEKTCKIEVLSSDSVIESKKGYYAAKEGEIRFKATYLATGLTKEFTIQAKGLTKDNVHLVMDNDSYRVAEVISFSLQTNSSTISIPNIQWTIDDAAIGKITDSGSLLLLKTGKLTITGQSNNQDDLSVSLEINVKNKSFFTKEGFKKAESFLRKAVGHFSLFLVLGFFLFLTFYHLSKLNQDERIKLLTSLALAGLVYCFIIAGTSEIFQALTDNRGPSFNDVMLDTAGSLTGILVLWLFFLIKKQIEKNHKT